MNAELNDRTASVALRMAIPPSLQMADAKAPGQEEKEATRLA
jgi:hypothetical protein